MKIKYKFIHFIKTAEKPKSPATWSCHNNSSGTELGEIKWYLAWRQYCYFPTCQAVYSTGCLADIKDFMDQLR